MVSSTDNEVSSEPRGVLVLGMHRSGTSLVTRLLNLIGLPLSVPDDLHLAADGNPAGHWESKNLTAINDELLHRRGCDWTCPPMPAEEWFDPDVDALRDYARTTFAGVYPASQWLWKDPRTCITLPFWRGVLPGLRVVAIVHRDPIEVSESLSARNGSSKELGLALWERYNRSLLCAARDQPALVSSFVDVLADPVRWCERAIDLLGPHDVRVRGPSDDEITEYVDPRLRHHARRRDMTDDRSLSEEQRRLAGCLDAISGPHERLPAAELGEETAWCEALLAERRALVVAAKQFDDERRRLASAITTKQAEIERLQGRRP